MKLPKQTIDRLTKEGRPPVAPAGALARIAEERLRRGLETPPAPAKPDCEPASEA